MTIKEFDNTKWTGQMKCRYKLKEYDIVSVDFEERLIAIQETNDEEQLDWKRCENVTLI